jgi:kynurenine formamidase
MMELLDLARRARVYDLAQPYFTGMPHYPSHPPFLFGLTKLHGDMVGPGGVSSASEALALGGHTGTHMDALCHFSRNGRLHGGDEVAPRQSHSGGIAVQSIETVVPVVRRGVLLDVAASEGMEILPADFAVTPRHIEAAAEGAGVRVEAGDVVLLRTGWARYFSDAARYTAPQAPGPDATAAEWLSSRGVFAVGSDTMAFEKTPNPAMPVHVHLLVEAGIHIFEVLNLEELAGARACTFLFVAAPLKIRGGTGAPVRPVALVV